MPDPIHYTISEAEFDLAQIPKDARKVGSKAFRKHVTAFFEREYAGMPGSTSVEFRDGLINVTWIPEVADVAPMEAILDLLNSGQYDKVTPMLETLLQANPNDAEALYNLGMVYSDQGKLAKAKETLLKSTRVSPNHANSFVALGVAILRDGDTDAARPVLEQAVKLDPDSPYALRTLGTLYAKTGDRKKAIDALRHAVVHAPDDPIALLTLAQTLLEQDFKSNALEADTLLQKVLQVSPHGEVAERAKDARRAIASRSFRTNAQGSLRPDALEYCIDALQRFENMPQARLVPILLEMAALGNKGLPVNDPDSRYQLRSYPGEFSALQIICMMHVGMKKIDPSQGSGFDIDREYDAALTMYTSKT